MWLYIVDICVTAMLVILYIIDTFWLYYYIIINAVDIIHVLRFDTYDTPSRVS